MVENPATTMTSFHLLIHVWLLFLTDVIVTLVQTIDILVKVEDGEFTKKIGHRQCDIVSQPTRMEKFMLNSESILMGRTIYKSESIKNIFKMLSSFKTNN